MYNYVRTGLLGFIMTNQHYSLIPKDESRLFIVGFVRDMMHAKNENDKPQIYYSNHLSNLIFKQIGGLNAW